jgi:DNA repair exonuclease SbcCD ATPase subunit
MKIKRLTLLNFKCFEERTLDFGEINYLSGGNGVGKTSILEAITVCYYGKLPDGSAGIDRLVMNGKESASVTIEDPEIGSITRNIKLSGSELLLDGKEIKQDNFQTLYKLVPIEYFLASVNPNYWKELDYKERRSILSDLTPRVDREEIFLGNYPENLARKFSVMTYQDANKEVKSLISSIDQLKGIIQQTKIDLKSPANIEAFNNTEFEELEKEFLEYQRWKPAYDKLQQVDNMRTVVSEWKEASEKYKSTSDQIVAALTSIKFSNNEENKFTLNDIKGFVASKQDVIKTIATFEARYDAKMDAYGKKKVAMDSGKCPVCGCNVTEKHSGHLIQDISFSKDTDTILSLKEKLAKIEIWESELNSHSIKMLNLESQKSKYYDLLSNPAMKEMAEEVDKILNDADAVMNAYESIEWTQQKESRYSELRDKKSRLQGASEQAQIESDRLQALLKDSNGRIVDYEKSLADYKILAEALSPKGVDSQIQKQKAGYIEDAVNKYTKGITIETVQELKSTDGFKEVFNVFKDGTIERKLSTGQKMRLAVCFCMAIQDLLEQKYGYKPRILFMDDSSLVTSLADTITVSEGSQRFFAINTDEVELTLTVKNENNE